MDGMAMARGCVPSGRGVWAPHQEGMRACSWLQKTNSPNLKMQAEMTESLSLCHANITILTGNRMIVTDSCDHRLTLYLWVIWGAALPFWAQWVCPTCGTLGYKLESWLTVCQWDCSFCHVFSSLFGCVVPWRVMTSTVKRIEGINNVCVLALNESTRAQARTHRQVSSLP